MNLEEAKRAAESEVESATKDTKAKVGEWVKQVFKTSEGTVPDSIPILSYPSDLGGTKKDLKYYYIRFSIWKNIGGMNKAIAPVKFIHLPMFNINPEVIVPQWQVDRETLAEGMLGMLGQGFHAMEEMAGLKNVAATVIGSAAGSAVGGALAGRIGTTLGAIAGAGAGIAASDPQRAAANILRAGQISGGPASEVASALGRLAGVAMQPFDAPYFDGIGMRIWDCNFELLPENEADVQLIYAIINSFKYHSLPDLTAGNTVFTYPDKFKIEFYRPDLNDKEKSINDKGTYLPWFPHQMVLNHVSISYGDGETWTPTKLGTPSKLRIDMSFQETERFTRGNMFGSYGNKTAQKANKANIDKYKQEWNTHVPTLNSPTDSFGTTRTFEGTLKQ